MDLKLAIVIGKKERAPRQQTSQGVIKKREIKRQDIMENKIRVEKSKGVFKNRVKELKDE